MAIITTLVGLGVLLVFTVLGCVLEVFLARRESIWPGLALPILAGLYAVVMALSYTAAPDTPWNQVLGGVLAVFLVLVFALFLVLWAVVVSFWCCVFAFGIAGIGGVAGSILMLFFTGQPAAAFFQLGISLAAGGLGLLTGMGMRKLTLLCAQFTKKSCVGLFHFFLGKKAEINV